MTPQTAYEKYFLFRQSLKKTVIENLIFKTLWVSFLGFLLFKASYDFDLQIETRIGISIGFSLVVLFFSTYNSEPRYIKGHALLLALIHTKKNITSNISHESSLHDKSINAPLLMALQYKYGNAKDFLKTVDYSLDSGLKHTDFNRYFSNAISNALTPLTYSQSELNSVDDAIINIIDRLKINEFYSCHFTSRIRAIFFHEITHQLHTQNLKAYKSEDLKTILIHIKNRLPNWSQFIYFIDAVLLTLDSQNTRKKKKIKSLIRKIDIELLIDSLSLDATDISINALNPTNEYTIKNLKRAYEQQNCSSNSVMPTELILQGQPNRQANEYEIHKHNQMTNLKSTLDVLMSPEFSKKTSTTASISVDTSLLLSLNTVARNTIVFNDAIINKGKSDEYSIEQLVINNKNVQVKEGYEVFAQYSGDAHGGRTSYYAKHNSEQVDLFESITFSFDNDGALSAFWFHLFLPTFGVYWHGLYESDYKFITTQEKLISAIMDCRIQSNDDEILINLKGIQLGFCIKNTNEYIDVSCLTFNPNTGIYMSSVRLYENGKSEKIDPTILIKTTVRLLY